MGESTVKLFNTKWAFHGTACVLQLAGWLLASPWIPPTLPVGRPRVAPPSSLDTPVAGSKCRHGTGEEVTPDMVIIRAETGYTQQKIQHWWSPRRHAVKIPFDPPKFMNTLEYVLGILYSRHLGSLGW